MRVSDLDNAVAAVTSQLIKDGLTGAAMTFAANAEAELARLRAGYVDPETRALEKRCAERWAKSAVRIVQLSGVEWNCDSCGRCNYSYEVTPLHTHNCDAAKILGLEREGEG